MPIPPVSGLAETSGRLTLNARIYSSMKQEPQDAIDPNIITAASTLMDAYSGDFTLGGDVLEIDLLGGYGQALSAQAGYVNQDNRLFRVMEIIIPVIVDNMFIQGGTISAGSVSGRTLTVDTLNVTENATITGNETVGGSLTVSGAFTPGSISQLDGTVGWLNVKDPLYGAKGDGVMVTDAAINSGQNILTSTTATFTSADIGKVVMVDGAGGTNIPLGTTISGFTDSHHVTLTANASATVSGMTCYYGTDDHAAIVAALTAAHNLQTRGDDSHFTSKFVPVIYFPFAIYMNGSSVTPSFGQALDIRGDNSLIISPLSSFMDFNAAGHLLESNMHFEGLVFDGGGGHTFKNINIHGELVMEHFSFNLRNGNYGFFWLDDIVNSTTTACYKATFRDYTYWQGLGTRSVEAFHLLTNGGANLTDITFEHGNGPNPPGSTPTGMDNTQYQYFLSSNDANGAVTNITFRNLLAASFYGGFIKLQGVKNATLDGLNFYNNYIESVSNDLISIGANGQAFQSHYITVRNISRNNGLGTGGAPPPYDISFAAGTYGVLLENNCGQSPFAVNLNGCSGAVIIGGGANTQGQTFTIANQGGDTVVINNGDIQIGGPSVVTGTGYPFQNSMKAWNFDPAHTSRNLQASGGTIYTMQFPVTKNASVTKAWVGVQASGASGSAGQNWMGLYNSAGVQLAQGSCDSLVGGATGPVSVTFLGGTVSVTPANYYVSVVLNAGTTPNLYAAGGPASLLNTNVTTSAARCTVTGNNATTLPGTITTFTTSSASPYWVGLS